MPGGAEITASAGSRPRALMRRGAGYEVTLTRSARATVRRRPGVTVTVNSPSSGRGTLRPRASGRQSSPAAVTPATTSPDRALRASIRHRSWPGGRRTSGRPAKTGLPAVVVTPGTGRPVRSTGFVRPRTTRRSPSVLVPGWASGSWSASQDASRRSSCTSRQPRQLSGSVLVTTVLSGTSDRSSAVAGQIAQTASAGSTRPARHRRGRRAAGHRRLRRPWAAWHRPAAPGGPAPRRCRRAGPRRRTGQGAGRRFRFPRP